MEPVVVLALGVLSILGQLHNYGIDAEKHPHLKNVRVRRQDEYQPYDLEHKDEKVQDMPEETLSFESLLKGDKNIRKREVFTTKKSANANVITTERVNNINNYFDKHINEENPFVRGAVNKRNNFFTTTNHMRDSFNSLSRSTKSSELLDATTTPPIVVAKYLYKRKKRSYNSNLLQPTETQTATAGQRTNEAITAYGTNYNSIYGNMNNGKNNYYNGKNFNGNYGYGSSNTPFNGYNTNINSYNQNNNGYNQNNNRYNPNNSDYNPNYNGYNQKNNGYNPNYNGYKPNYNGYNPNNNGFTGTTSQNAKLLIGVTSTTPKINEAVVMSAGCPNWMGSITIAGKKLCSKKPVVVDDSDDYI